MTAAKEGLRIVAFFYGLLAMIGAACIPPALMQWLAPGWPEWAVAATMILAYPLWLLAVISGGLLAIDRWVMNR